MQKIIIKKNKEKKKLINKEEKDEKMEEGKEDKKEDNFIKENIIGEKNEDKEI